jgi:hypothetical protein
MFARKGKRSFGPGTPEAPAQVACPSSAFVLLLNVSAAVYIEGVLLFVLFQPAWPLPCMPWDGCKPDDLGLVFFGGKPFKTRLVMHGLVTWRQARWS